MRAHTLYGDDGNKSNESIESVKYKHTGRISCCVDCKKSWRPIYFLYEFVFLIKFIDKILQPLKINRNIELFCCIFFASSIKNVIFHSSRLLFCLTCLIWIFVFWKKKKQRKTTLICVPIDWRLKKKNSLLQNRTENRKWKWFATKKRHKGLLQNHSLYKHMVFFWQGV